MAEILGVEPEDAYRPPTPPAARVLPGRAGELIEVFDRKVDDLFERHLRGNPVADRVMYGASALGDFSLIWHLVGTAKAVVGDETTEKEAVRLAVSLAVETALINAGVKNLFRRRRPTWDQHRPRGLRKPKSSSFPSGHATSGFMAATLLSTGRPRQRPLWFAVAAVVAASRVHVKIHHGSDVAAGALIGLGLGRLARKIWRL
jgi:membrane-associated phospholipid phosphatase